MSKYDETIPDSPIARAELAVAYNEVDSTEVCWLTYRLLWAMPWPADTVPASAAAARTIGAICDQTTLSCYASRPLADTWVSWASKWTKKFGALLYWANSYGVTQTRLTPPQTRLSRARHQSSHRTAS